MQFVGHLLFGSMVRLMVTSSKRAYATGCVAGSSNQSPCPYSRPLLTFTSAGDSNTGLTQSLWGLWVLVSTRFYLSPPSVSCCRVGGIECSSACIGPFEESCHYLHYLHHSLASGKEEEWQPTPVFLPGKFHGWSLVGYSPWGPKKGQTWLRDFPSLHFKEAWGQATGREHSPAHQQKIVD